jgi:hypothetical protein
MWHSPAEVVFPALGAKTLTCRFDAGAVTSDAGLLLLAQADHKLGLTKRLAEQILDRRQTAKVVHPVVELLRERIYAICAGYEDANDLEQLCADPALLLCCERRLSETLGSQPTISRFENSVDKKDLLCLALTLAQVVIAQLPKNTRSVVLDVDATDDACHGQQEGEHFNAYYDAHCYLPLYVHVTGQDGRQRLLAALLREGNAASKVGLFALLRRAIWLLRCRFPAVKITLRADSGFGDGQVLAFCRAQGLAYTLAISSNPRLRTHTAALEQQVLRQVRRTGEELRCFTAFLYQADSWSHLERVVAKVETVQAQINVRFVVSSRRGQDPKRVYRFYCARGDRENRIKETKNDLCAGRTSCHRFLANQLRLLLHAAAHVLVCALQEALIGTRLARAQAGTLRLKLIKLGAEVECSCRRVWFHLPAACPVQDLWSCVCGRFAPGAT